MNDLEWSEDEENRGCGFNADLAAASRRARIELITVSSVTKGDLQLKTKKDKIGCNYPSGGKKNKKHKMEVK